MQRNNSGCEWEDYTDLFVREELDRKEEHIRDVTTCVPDFDLPLFLGPIPESLSQLRSLQALSLGGNKLSGAVNMFGTSPVMSQVTLRLFFRYDS
jgi:hypothetical protein